MTESEADVYSTRGVYAAFHLCTHLDARSVHNWHASGRCRIMVSGDFEIVRSREAEGLSLYLRPVEGGWTFRVFPVRDPLQSRFWCLQVEPCASASAIARTSPYDPFFVAPAMTRDQMMEMLTLVKTETATWLALSLTCHFRRNSNLP
jgi:hypothetical protein